MVRTNTIAENRNRRIDAEPDPEIPTGIGELGIGSGMVQTYHQTQRIARDRAGCRCCGRSAAYFDGNKGTDCVFVAIEVNALGLRKPFFDKIMRFQHEADPYVAGCIRYANDGAAGDGVNRCAGDSLAAEIEVRSDSNPPIEPLPGCRSS